MITDCSNATSALSQFSLLMDCSQLDNGTLRVATPFLYPDGSHIDVFISNTSPLFDETTLSDLGQTVAYLADLHIYPFKNVRRRKILADVCRALKISETNGELMLRVPKDGNISDGVSRLAQACVRVADLSFPGIERV